MKLTAFLEGISIGALAMFLMDPEEGNRRRAMIKDQAVSQVNRKRKAIDVMTRDFANRAQGIKHKVSNISPDGMSMPQMRVPSKDDLTEIVTAKWTPATCLVAGIGGALMFIYGMGKKGITGGLMQTAGAAMIGKAFYDTEHRFESSSSNQGNLYPEQGGQPQFDDGAQSQVTDRGQAGMI